ncbi:YiaA/YiaB family inner membrane protein [Solimonas sp. SE-A11]|uniref:YiaA/YiaB family inner membrane protein n=1 Tax=Solimonas sp. SE-A11 TaxID=3054954 RepID=UPI00259D0C76|nr:YiaA/YiaB family inner membrane protein [Solimonas sp. SE-A11]MDM4770337.1 YiaA/YiaB family inner membrane protein [Solimonas sp. SE-A11]
MDTSDNFDSTRLDSPGWIFFVKASFACAFGGMVFGLTVMPVEIWMRGYMILGTLFLTGATFTLAKTLRDQFEANKLINKVAQARTEKLLKEYGIQNG